MRGQRREHLRFRLKGSLRRASGMVQDSRIADRLIRRRRKSESSPIVYDIRKLGTVPAPSLRSFRLNYFCSAAFYALEVRDEGQRGSENDFQYKGSGHDRAGTPSATVEPDHVGIESGVRRQQAARAPAADHRAVVAGRFRLGFPGLFVLINPERASRPATNRERRTNSSSSTWALAAWRYRGVPQHDLGASSILQTRARYHFPIDLRLVPESDVRRHID
jgi:hypothetical protein